MSGPDPGDVRRATPEEPTYVHGGAGAGPRTTQATPSPTGRRRGAGDGATERRMVPRERPGSYYGRPVVKPPVWSWEIPTYFFVGGTGGASSALALAAELAGNRELARRAWLVALAAISSSPAFLISDLGKPSRFLNMMRVFKVTSPMSVGSWLLAANGAAVLPAAAYGLLGRPRRLGRPAQVAAAILGLPLATYTATLVSNTSIPVWSEARWDLPVSFAASAAASAGAAATMLTDPKHAGPARRLAIAAAILESLSTEAMERRLGELGEPYRTGAAGRLTKAAKALVAGGAAVAALAARRNRPAVLAGGAMLIAGSACERWAVFRAGFQSALDPGYTVGPQRERIARGERQRTRRDSPPASASAGRG